MKGFENIWLYPVALAFKCCEENVVSDHLCEDIILNIAAVLLSS